MIVCRGGVSPPVHRNQTVFGGRGDPSPTKYNRTINPNLHFYPSNNKIIFKKYKKLCKKLFTFLLKYIKI